MSADPEPESSKQDESRLSSPSPSDSDSSDDGAAPKKPTEWLATARKKRTTAGNRMKSMLANEEPDSDMELLFAEDDDDQGFTDVAEDASDVQMDSSSDDEDEKNAGEDDFEGEKELERQAKERRAGQRKRKAQEAIPAKFRKKVRIDPTTPAATTAPAPRPKKKSERASWLPTAADMPTRASSRQTTRLSKEQLHAQMEEREARRLKQLEHMQKKAARMEALKKPPMTQEERLREAELVEKRNSKSLNRWEEAEKQREEERRVRLAALNERTLKGPVITFWSGTRQWKDGGAAKYVVMEEKPKRGGKKAKDKDKDKDKEQEKDKDKAKDVATGGSTEGNGAREPEVPSGDSGPTKVESEQPPTEDVPRELEQKDPPEVKESTGDTTTREPETSHTDTNAPASTPQPAESAPLMAMPPMPPPASGLAAPAPAPPDTSTTPTTSSATPDPKPSSVLAPPVLAPPVGVDTERTSSPTLNHQEPPKSNVLAPPKTSQSPQPPASSKPETAEDVKTDAPLQPVRDKEGSAEKAGETSSDRLTEKPAEKPESGAPSEAPEAPPVDTTATRRTIIYQNFDENAIKDKTVQTQILFGRKMNRIAKPSPAPLCVITNHPARYRDPQTGLPFHNIYAYREIQRLRRGDYRWSRLLGAWAGSGTYAARGVPARFLNPDAKGKEKETKDDEVKDSAEGEKGESGKDAAVKTEEVKT